MRKRRKERSGEGKERKKGKRKWKEKFSVGFFFFEGVLVVGGKGEETHRRMTDVTIFSLSEKGQEEIKMNLFLQIKTSKSFFFFFLLPILLAQTFFFFFFFFCFFAFFPPPHLGFPFPCLFYVTTHTPKEGVFTNL